MRILVEWRVKEDADMEQIGKRLVEAERFA